LRIVDVNVLVYAVNASDRHHGAAHRWLTKALGGMESVGFPVVSLLGFVRLITSPAIVRKPVSVERATSYVKDWMAQPPARLVSAGPAHVELLCRLLDEAGTAGNLVTDAHIAALALEQAAAVVTFDNDFRRFPGLPVETPD